MTKIFPVEFFGKIGNNQCIHRRYIEELPLISSSSDGNSQILANHYISARRNNEKRRPLRSLSKILYNDPSRMTKISYFIPTSFDKNAGRNGNADQAFHRFPFLSYETDILMRE